ncbi:hypothetical protein POJ06DRAFT_42192 [Lipomyces tetrasporus]|uniref:Uncharacterized protein n=1 Tax=Lipomyces tetrasporus TaxID=54092 RepID=A0AAD7QK27_9ASCO|nr:uncharacterized protein POJ06DRAFT_42192 [Lipomyces tetrasporus]KAJ8096673.1 hypothetical protein POJ06DRAFT_42192 [Lipomyces tetrasporus]
MTTVAVSPASRYRANLALFDARHHQQVLHQTNAYAAAVHASRMGAATNTGLLHPPSTAPHRQISPDGAAHSMGEGGAHRRRRRRRTLHNHRFSDRSESESGSASEEEVDSDFEMDRRGRRLTRVGDDSGSDNVSCASSSRVLSSTRGVQSDDDEQRQGGTDDGPVIDNDVYNEVENFKKLLAQAQQQDCFRRSTEDISALTCDDDDSESDDEYDSESADDNNDDDDDEFFFSRHDSLGKYELDDDDDDYYDEDIRSEVTRGSTSSTLSSSTSASSSNNRYTVTDLSVDNDPGRVVRVDKFVRDIVPDGVTRRSVYE